MPSESCLVFGDRNKMKDEIAAGLVCIPNRHCCVCGKMLERFRYDQSDPENLLRLPSSSHP